MIKTIAWMIFAFFCPTASAVQEVCASELDSLLNAIATIESSNDPAALGDFETKKMLDISCESIYAISKKETLICLEKYVEYAENEKTKALFIPLDTKATPETPVKLVIKNGGKSIIKPIGLLILPKLKYTEKLIKNNEILKKGNIIIEQKQNTKKEQEDIEKEIGKNIGREKRDGEKKIQKNNNKFEIGYYENMPFLDSGSKNNGGGNVKDVDIQKILQFSAGIIHHPSECVKITNEANLELSVRATGTKSLKSLEPVNYYALTVIDEPIIVNITNLLKNKGASLQISLLRNSQKKALTLSISIPNAAGLYQISRIYLKDVNRILGYRKYILADRFDPQKSEEMVRIYLGHYGKNKTLEDIARIHNGGPRGWSRPATKKYWLKIKKWLTKKGGE